MSRTPRIPAYSHHKASGQAVVKVKSRSYYLGKFGSGESKERYAKIVADLLSGRAITPPTPQNGGITPDLPQFSISDLANQYQRHAESYYQKNGRPTSEVTSIRCALRYLLTGYANLPAATFAVGDLRTVRQQMVDAGLSRGVCNQNTGRITRMFRWGGEEELVPASVWSSLLVLPGLRAGRTKARETAPVMPVEDAVIDKTLPMLSPTIGAMVRLQRATGMRPCEVCQLRPVDLDRPCEVWIYTPAEHKTEHHSKQRRIPIGPKGQVVLRNAR